ncbi:MAG: tetratricopeptide repeat protein [Gammaproteobacteria bacterium]|nr:tetratricopeptide repeat protein [Gammaproteobacteria bacterium]
MSLLLDALKKAAEQKAEKSKQKEAPQSSGDETIIAATPEDASALETGDDAGSQVLPRDVEDETELNAAELEARYERSRSEGAAGDETDIEAPEQTDTHIPEPSAQLQTGEDETIVFVDDDVSEFMGDPAYINRDRPPEDETDLSQAEVAEDQTGIEQTPPTPPEDETDLSQFAQREQDTDVRSPPAAEDQTDISIPPPLADDIDQGYADAGVVAEDTDLSRIREPEDTNLDQAGKPAGEDTDLSRVGAKGGEDTDISRTGAAAPTDPEPSEPQDLSLLLATDPDQTGQTTRTSPTDPRLPGGLPATGDDELALVDTTQHKLPDEQTAATEATTEAAASATATTGVRLDTLTTEGTTTRTEATATRTYAPDNYDRTLMKLPTDDASRLFAGMKSDGDVVMTPDYAKKVFLSKSSAQRMQHLRVYAGIFVMLLIAVGVYAVYEFANQSDAIETSLRPLKRDPMPGVIQPQREPDIQLFTETGEVSQQTIDIVESADGGVEAEVADQGVIAGGDETGADADAAEEAAAGDTATATGQVAAVESSAAGPASDSDASPAPATGSSTDSGTVAAIEPAAGADGQPVASTDTAAGNKLEITTGSRLDEKQLKLREAYSAYRAGNDARALELYSEVLREDPTNRNALLGRAAIHVQNGNVVNAVDDYQALLLANPKDSLAMSSLLSVANLSPRESESRLKLMIREEPESPYLNFALGNAYGAQNRWQEAQGFYFTALQNNPDDPNYAYNLAVSLEHIKQPQAAMNYYRRALANMGNGLATFSRDVVNQRLEVLGGS